MTAKTKRGRPRAGEVLPEEPTDAEIAAGAANAPSDEVIVKFNGEDYPIAELGFMDWRIYLSALLPALESSVKALIPVIQAGSRAWSVLRSLNGETLNQLRAAAMSGDDELLADTLDAKNIKGYSEEDIQALKGSADDVGAFTAAAGGVIARPVLSAFKDINASDVLLKVADRLPELAVSTLANSLHKRGIEVNRHILRIKVEEKDGFDLFNIVIAQLEHYQHRGKLRDFFAQIMMLVRAKLPTEMKNLGSATPSA